jgi:hypothetical protein
VADLHEQLLAAITQHGGPLGVGTALRAVVELHAPVERFEGSTLPVCRGCDKHRTAKRPPWPCSTIQAIARELEVDG